MLLNEDKCYEYFGAFTSNNFNKYNTQTHTHNWVIVIIQLHILPISLIFT